MSSAGTGVRASSSPMIAGGRRPRSSVKCWLVRRYPRRTSPRQPARSMVLDTHPLDSRTGRFPWQVALLFVAVAAISRAPALVVLAFGAVGTWLVVEITGRLALAAVDARVTLAPDRIIAGELPVATVEIANRKPLPLPWLEARLFLGEGVEPPNPAPGTPHGWIDCGFPLRGRERVVVRLPVRVPARGAYAIGPLRFRAVTGSGSPRPSGPSLSRRRSSRTRPRSRCAIAPSLRCGP